jgi:flagellar biosynthesis GTPase FlhF
LRKTPRVPQTHSHDIPKPTVFYKLTVEGDFGPKEAVTMDSKSLRKGVLLAAGLLAISASPMFASAAAIPQDAGQTQAAPADQAKPSRPDLNLTDDQKAQMKKIHEDAKAQIAAVNNDSSLSADQKHAKIRSIHMSTHKQTEALLTLEQRQAQKQWRKSHPRQNQNEEQQPPANS